MDRTVVHAGEPRRSSFAATALVCCTINRATRRVAPAFLGGNMKKKKRIRPLAICIFRHYDHILVAEGYDPVKKELFYRPLGGGIEFGEYSAQTIQRELQEEIGAEVRDLKYLGTLENVFVFNGSPGHEMVQIFDGSLKDAQLYEQTVILG